MYVFQPFITSKHSTPAEAIMEGAHLPSLNARANEFLMFHGTKPEVRGPSMGETSKNAGFFFRENLSELVNDLGEATLVQASIWQSAEELRIYINRYVCMYIYIYEFAVPNDQCNVVSGSATKQIKTYGQGRDLPSGKLLIMENYFFLMGKSIKNGHLTYCKQPDQFGRNICHSC